MEKARYKMKNASKLSENEIKNQIIDILAPSLENSSKEDLLFHLVKIYSAITADIDILSDGEVIDMIHNYFNRIGIEKIIDRD